MRILASELAGLLRGTLNGADVEVTGFATDSRNVTPGDAFLAIRGERADGHDFAADVIRRGATVVLVERPVDAPHILVPSLVDALAHMALARRNEYVGPVIGVTGSAGKTTVKELITAALSPLGPILKTPANRNTEWTVPLIWAEVERSHRAVVVEMAMRGFGQIAHLARFSRPTIGVVTNIGHAHVEMVGSRAWIAEAKGELLLALPPTGTSVLCAEDEFLSELRKRAPGPVLTFGFGETADSRILGYRPLSWYQAELTGVTQGVAWQATIPAVGRHIATGAEVPLDQAAIALATAELPPMRMEVRESNGVTLILDNYNASPASMVAAIETLAEMPVSGRRRAVIGAMRELGSETEDAHRQVGETLARNGIDDVIFFGEPTELAQAARGAGTIARSIDDVRMFLAQSQTGDAVLIKGSRALELERALS